MKIRYHVLAALTTALLSVITVTSWAFSVPYLTSVSWGVGTSRFARVTGTFTTLPGETLTTVQIVALSSSGAQLSTAQGTIDQAHQSFKAEEGDYQMSAYYAVFWVTNRNNQVTKYYSRPVPWTK